MDMQAYQRAAESTAIYREQPEMYSQLQRVSYTALGLNGEAGEVAEKVKKVIRDDGGVVTTNKIEQIMNELGDVLWYVALCAAECGLTLNEVAAANLDKLQGRADRGTLQGSGDNR